jgi:Signal transduction histidine kinase
MFTPTPRGFSRSLWNVLRNAVKFTDQGGAITIITSNDAQDRLDITFHDTGIGMTADTLSKLFIPFEQADPMINRRYGGLGLGMAISNALVDVLDGEIRAESPGLGLGSTFTITFPTVDPAANGSEPTSASRKSQDKVRLLLVEDHGDTARALARLLENRCFTTKIAPNLATALEAIGREEFRSFSLRPGFARWHRHRLHQEGKRNLEDASHRAHRFWHAGRCRALPESRLRRPPDKACQSPEARGHHVAITPGSPVTGGHSQSG